MNQAPISYHNILMANDFKFTTIDNDHDKHLAEYTKAYENV